MSQHKSAGTGEHSLEAELQVDGSYLLRGDLTFETAPQALEKLEALVADQQHLLVDLSGVGKVNSAALAVMIESLGSATKLGHTLCFQSIPDVVLQLAAICETDELLLSRQKTP